MNMIPLADPIPSAGSRGFDGPATVRLSRNETESLCLKAARGAGLSWGLAEEAGFAAGWLAMRGIDGAAPLLAHLMAMLGPGADVGVPRPAPGHWRAVGRAPLCPISLGAALLDHALIADGPFSRPTRLDAVRAPVLLLPFLAGAAQRCAKTIVIEWPDGQLRIAPDADFDRAAARILATHTILALNVLVVPDGPQASQETDGPPELAAATLAGLDALALRTTVPATAASRKGAGTTISDND